MDAHDYAVAEAAFSSVRATYSDPAAVDFEIALAQYHDHRLAQSEKTLTEAIEANRRASETYVLLCKVLADSGATTRALRVASQGSRAFPDSYDLISAKGTMELKLQYFADAVGSYEKAARLNPRSSNVKRDLAVAEWRAGMRERSAAAFEQAIREFPADAETYQVYAVLLLEEGSWHFCPLYDARYTRP
jgi:tetratricopeptide (TPR) repeat protein